MKTGRKEVGQGGAKRFFFFLFLSFCSCFKCMVTCILRLQRTDSVAKRTNSVAKRSDSAAKRSDSVAVWIRSRFVVPS